MTRSTLRTSVCAASAAGFGRYQHHVDYTSFARNKLKLRDDVTISNDIDEYGMVLEVDEETENEFNRNRKLGSLRREQEEFFSRCVTDGKTIDQALVLWREYRDKSLRIKRYREDLK